MIYATEDHPSCSSPKAYRTREARMPENLEVGFFGRIRLALRRMIKLDDTIRNTQIGKTEKLRDVSKISINYPSQLHSSDQQKGDNQQQAKSGHFATTSAEMSKDLGFMSPCMPCFRPFEHQKILQVKLTIPAFPRDDDASCRLAGMIVLLVASVLRLNVEHLLLSTPPLFIWLMLVFIWLGIVSGISVVLLWLLRLPKKQSLLLLIAILSTIGSYACAIAVVLPFEQLRAPFLAVAISGLSVYVFVLLKKGKLPP